MMLDEALIALADAHRRRLLTRLVEDSPRPEVAVLKEMAESRAEVEKPQLRMYHVHLPKLEDWGFVEWDRDDHVVTAGPNFGEIRPVVELLQEYETKRPESRL